MDGSRFDTLTRSLGDPRSRRGALASLVGGTLGLLGLTETTAKKKKGKGNNKKRRRGRGGQTTAPAPACAEGQTTCGGQCVLLTSDPQHCGACGTVCPAGNTCISGVCWACRPEPGSCGDNAFCDRGLRRCQPCRGAGGSCSIGGGFDGGEACCSDVCNGTCT